MLTVMATECLWTLLSFGGKHYPCNSQCSEPRRVVFHVSFGCDRKMPQTQLKEKEFVGGRTSSVHSGVACLHVMCQDTEHTPRRTGIGY